ncbi:hypothetical protein DL768_001854 [Monosporascus sp. mg162]|nr:hypothetical protein DL768_001854 [Monosporascus sp. mg162]
MSTARTNFSTAHTPLPTRSRVDRQHDVHGVCGAELRQHPRRHDEHATDGAPQEQLPEQGDEKVEQTGADSQKMLLLTCL